MYNFIVIKKIYKSVMNPNISYELIIITIKNDVRPLLLGKNVGTMYNVYDKGMEMIQ